MFPEQKPRLNPLNNCEAAQEFSRDPDVVEAITMWALGYTGDAHLIDRLVYLRLLHKNKSPDNLDFAFTLVHVMGSKLGGKDE